MSLELPYRAHLRIQNFRNGRGAKFYPKFFNDLFRRFPKNFPIPPKCRLSPKIYDDLFLVNDLFRVLMSYFSVGGQIRSRHRYGRGA